LHVAVVSSSDEACIVAYSGRLVSWMYPCRTVDRKTSLSRHWPYPYRHFRNCYISTHGAADGDPCDTNTGSVIAVIITDTDAVIIGPVCFQAGCDTKQPDQQPAKALCFWAVCSSIRSFGHIIATVFHELLEQSLWNLQGIFTSPSWWPD